MERVNQLKNFLILVFLSMLIGGIVGVLVTLFGVVLLEISTFRIENFSRLIWFLAPMGMLFMYLFQRYGGNATKGMSLVFQVGHNEETSIPKRLVPFTIVGTWMTHLFGGSAGREGVAVQIGATVANFFDSFSKIKNKQTIFLITGMSAGFAGLFGTPIAAIFFSLEVLTVGKLRYDALTSAFIAAYTASFISHQLGLEKFTVILTATINMNGLTIMKLIFCGIIFGVVGRYFVCLLKKCKTFFSSIIPCPIFRIGVIGAFLSILLYLFFQGRYSGLGTNLIDYSFSNEEIFSYDWALKLIFTVVTLSVGFQGGEVTPLFSIGATLGGILGTLLGLPVDFMAALGYASVFGSATNTILAPMFIGAEVFGYSYLPYFFLVCSVAYIVNDNQSIYHGQKNR